MLHHLSRRGETAQRHPTPELLKPGPPHPPCETVRRGRFCLDRRHEGGVGPRLLEPEAIDELQAEQ